MIIVHTENIFSGVHQATQVFDYCSHGKRGGCGGPQADGGVERKLSGINRELKEMGPQADGGGERQLENNNYPQMSQMDTDLEPVARIVND